MTRSSVSASSSTPNSPCHSMLAPVFLKSKRWDNSFAAWFNALSTSWRSILGHDVETAVSHGSSFAIALIRQWSVSRCQDVARGRCM